MIGRNLRIALLISLGVHIVGMSAVTIIAPDDFKKARPYTRVDFLGPILKKTAFDIMLENISPAAITTYRYMFLSPRSGDLKIAIPKRKSTIQEFPEYLENSMDALVMDFLESSKSVPDFGLDLGMNNFMLGKWGNEDVKGTNERNVIYRPEAPSIMRALYGDEDTFKIRVKVLIGRDGNIKKVEPLTTTGYPRLDITASKFVRGWIFEPSKDAIAADEWQEVDVILNTRD
jgi:hypothetical protein